MDYNFAFRDRVADVIRNKNETLWKKLKAKRLITKRVGFHSLSDVLQRLNDNTVVEVNTDLFHERSG